MKNKELIGITKDLEYEYRNSGYFVHSKMKVNKHYERPERKQNKYLYAKTKFPKQLMTKDNRNRNRKYNRDKPNLGGPGSNENENEAPTYFLFEDDDQKIKDLQEIQKMISADNEEDENKEKIGNITNTKKKDVVEVFDEYFENDAPSDDYNEDYFNDDDDGADGGMDSDVLDTVDGGDNW